MVSIGECTSILCHLSSADSLYSISTTSTVLRRHQQHFDDAEVQQPFEINTIKNWSQLIQFKVSDGAKKKKSHLSCHLYQPFIRNKSLPCRGVAAYAL